VEVTLWTSLSWSPIVIMISSKNVTSQAKYLVISSFFSKCPSAGLGKSWAYCMNATRGQSIELLDHVWPCGANCWLDNDGLLCLWSEILQNHDHCNLQHVI
jgi:hypothetical protein